MICKNFGQTKNSKGHGKTVYTQIRLLLGAVWSEYALFVHIKYMPKYLGS